LTSKAKTMRMTPIATAQMPAVCPERMFASGPRVERGDATSIFLL